jgi:hypothetical protein
MAEKRVKLHCKDCGREFEGTRKAQYCLQHRRQRAREAIERSKVEGYIKHIKVDKTGKYHSLSRCNESCKMWSECKTAVWRAGVLPCMPKMELLGDFRAETAPSGLRTNFRMNP